MKLLLLLACETAQPLPPPSATKALPTAQMVKVGEVSGLLVEGGQSEHAVLLLVDHFSDAARARAKVFAPAPVLAISSSTPIAAAEAYLSGLPGIQTVTILCDRADCPELNFEVLQPTSPGRRYFAKPDQQ